MSWRGGTSRRSLPLTNVTSSSLRGATLTGGSKIAKSYGRQSVTGLHYHRAVTQSAACDGGLVDRDRRAARCRRGVGEQRRVERGGPPPSVVGDARTELLNRNMAARGRVPAPCR